ncbi:hypothetical protein SEA_PROVOLONE_24 [Streptomyces phage Provolone]|nr:hypothetical protein SEA_PROVOLONE_24 [Streptomyces phage Provolone]
MGVGLYPPPSNDTGWLNGVSLGWTGSASYNLQNVDVRRIGSVVHAHGYGRMLAGLGPTTATGIHAGNLVGDPVIMSIPAAWRPAQTVVFNMDSSFGNWGVRIVGGTVGIYDGPPAAALEVNDFLTFSINYVAVGL